MAFTTSGQETEWALFLQPRSPHGADKQNMVIQDSSASSYHPQLKPVALPEYSQECEF